MKTNFENLRVYQLSAKLADTIWDAVHSWDAFARDTVGKQIVRAADSVGANIAEGAGGGSYQGTQRFVRNARGSLYEVKHWLRRAYRRNLLNNADVEALKPIADELAPKLNAFLKSIARVNRPDADETAHSEAPLPEEDSNAPD